MFVQQGPLTPEEVEAAVRRFKKAVIERALGAELRTTWVSAGHQTGGDDQSPEWDERQDGPDRRRPVAHRIPRDRDGSFEPRLIGKHERRFTGLTTRFWRSTPAG